MDVRQNNECVNHYFGDSSGSEALNELQWFHILSPGFKTNSDQNV